MKTLVKYAGVAVLFLSLGFAVPLYFNSSDQSVNIDIELSGQTSYPLGDIAEFEAVVKNPPKNFNKVVAWKVINNNKIINFKMLKEDNIIFPVGIKPTKITVLMHLAYIDPDTKKLSSSDFFIKEVTVGDIQPDNPNPPPTPETPKDGKYKIALLAYTNAKGLVTGGNVVSAAKALSEGYSFTASQVLKNEYHTLKDVYDGLKNNNLEKLTKAGEDKVNWYRWEKSIQEHIASLHKNKQLPELSDHAELFKEIAYGLSYVK